MARANDTAFHDLPFRGRCLNSSVSASERSCFASLALQALVFADPHPLSASRADRRQPQHAKCPAEQGKANASQERDPGALQGIASQKE